MFGKQPRENLTEEQLKALDEAAMLVFNARKQGAAVLRRSGIEDVPDSGWWGSPCGAVLPPPPSHHYCGCRNYTGNGGPCETQFIDFTGPDLGTGAPRRTCRHRPHQHMLT